MLDENVSFYYITKFFPPAIGAASFRAINLSTQLKQKGINAIIITSDNIPGKKTHSFNDSLNSFKKISFNMHSVFILVNLIRKIPKILKEKPYFIYASGPPFSIFYIGYILKVFKKVPLILEYRDPWLKNPYHKKSKPLEFILKKIQSFLLSRANGLIFVSDALRDFVLKDYKKKDKKRENSFVIENGINLKIIDEYSKEESDKNNAKQNRKMKIVFTATIYGERNPVPFFEILNELILEKKVNRNSISIELYGAYPGELEQKIKDLNLQDVVHLYGESSPETCQNAINEADFLLDISESDFNYPTFPFHFWQYFLARKKILYLGMENCYKANYLKNIGVGIILPLKNKKLMKNRFLKIVNDYFNEDIHLKAELPDNFLEENTWENRGKKLYDAICKITNISCRD